MIGVPETYATTWLGETVWAAVLPGVANVDAAVEDDLPPPQPASATTVGKASASAQTRVRPRTLGASGSLRLMTASRYPRLLKRSENLPGE
jgi:hypothetical protein